MCLSLSGLHSWGSEFPLPGVARLAHRAHWTRQDTLGYATRANNLISLARSKALSLLTFVDSLGSTALPPQLVKPLPFGALPNIVAHREGRRWRVTHWLLNFSCKVTYITSTHISPAKQVLWPHLTSRSPGRTVLLSTQKN